jgi:FkbM family methyltransferase
MKKIGNWWGPDNNNITNKMIVEETFTCIGSINHALKYVKKFDNAIDVGTWIGDSTVIISKLFGRTIGFEANNIIYECCVKNLEDRNITNCTMKNIGLSNETGEQMFYNGKSAWSGWISKKESFDCTISNKMSINTIKLDDLKLTNIDFIKIDVDSHETQVLEGARDFLTNNSPVILIESKQRSIVERQQDESLSPFEVLKSLGYKRAERVAKADYVFIRK